MKAYVSKGYKELVPYEKAKIPRAAQNNFVADHQERILPQHYQYEEESDNPVYEHLDGYCNEMV